jgi:hypothetical protein
MFKSSKRVPISPSTRQPVSSDCSFFVDGISILIKKYREKREDSDITQKLAYCIIIDDLVALLSDFSHR